MGVQVYTATHDGEGNPLSSLEKAFISFTYGGKKIEDFNLISVTNGDRIQRAISAAYSDITSDQVGLDGQLFWGGQYNPLTLDFTLATDGITAQELDAFIDYFKPGFKRELILSEHANRAIQARVASIPEYSFLPFEETRTIVLGGVEKQLTTTLYKGELSLSFICDHPHWYAKTSLLPSLDDATAQEINIAWEDGIPFEEMLPSLDTYTYLFLADGQKYEGEAETTTVGLYYAGTAPAYPQISFTANLTLQNNRIYVPTAYNSIIFGDQQLLFGLPSVFAAVNASLDIVSKYRAGDSRIDLQRELRENVYHYAVRAVAVGIVDGWTSDNYVNILENTLKNDFIGGFTTDLLSRLPSSYTAYIDCATGIVTIDYDFNSSSIHNEKAGDMIKSNYIKIEGRTALSADGIIDIENCIPITASNPALLNSLEVNYQYMYK